MNTLLWITTHIARIGSIVWLMGITLLAVHQIDQATPSGSISLEAVLNTLGLIALTWIVGFLAAWEWREDTQA